MKQLILFAAALSLTALAAPEASAKTLKSGVWKYKTSGHWVKGKCPAPRPGKGTVKIKRTGTRFRLQVLSGMTCSPLSMCKFKGRKVGKVWIATNSAKVDSEGGTAKNKIRITVKAQKRLTGTSRSEYKHPSGFTCRWGFNFTAWR